VRVEGLSRIGSKLENLFFIKHLSHEDGVKRVAVPRPTELSADEWTRSGG
jgi:hypothetical protein